MLINTNNNVYHNYLKATKFSNTISNACIIDYLKEKKQTTSNKKLIIHLKGNDSSLSPSITDRH